MDAKVTWKGRLSFSGSAESGFSLPLGADSQVGGDDDGFRPMELFLIGLAGCTAMDVISILQKKHQEVTNFLVQVHADRTNEHPRVFTHIAIEYILTGHHLDPLAVERAVQLSKDKYCPGQAMLNKTVPISHQITIQQIE